MAAINLFQLGSTHPSKLKVVNGTVTVWLDWNRIGFQQSNSFSTPREEKCVAGVSAVSKIRHGQKKNTFLNFNNNSGHWSLQKYPKPVMKYFLFVILSSFSVCSLSDKTEFRCLLPSNYFLQIKHGVFVSNHWKITGSKNQHHMINVLIFSQRVLLGLFQRME